ncbi:SgcJ/EcaC family oxidoreductase [Stakelama sp. CBK3Z-3]|uniref:SgcJ/EcaC family oxidoreductase n=1 Tax=Stakelama flava TaxID=2860338 RepID=A0ABS6XGS9_9SPHN|nr:SgcJ/EcaC family oxidoreductase [Stakelama flava]MBW4329429.1 SgcJ/EcaC family oxidoreductase [Stakelama flava]
MIVAAALVMTATPAADAEAAARAAILREMEASAAGWNSGDLNRFTAIYAGDATYVTGDGVIRGRANIAAHYADSFTKRGNTRGALRFEPLYWRALGNDRELLIARWILTPDRGAASSGMTSLVFEKREGHWRIIADHSS